MQVSRIPGVNFGIILVNYCCERLLTRDKIAISIKSCLKEKPALYCIARYCVLPALEQEQAEHVLNEAALHSLTELFEAVPDPRCRHGLRYDLPFLLTCLVAALLCTCDGTEAVAQWGRAHRGLRQGAF